MLFVKLFWNISIFIFFFFHFNVTRNLLVRAWFTDWWNMLESQSERSAQAPLLWIPNFTCVYQSYTQESSLDWNHNSPSILPPFASHPSTMDYFISLLVDDDYRDGHDTTLHGNLQGDLNNKSVLTYHLNTEDYGG